MTTFTPDWLRTMIAEKVAISTLERTLMRSLLESLEREAKLRDAGQWLLRHVTGKVMREKGITLNDTSNFDEFLAAAAAIYGEST